MQGNLTDCKIDEEGRAVWRWANGLVLTLDTASRPMHWHIGVGEADL